MVVNSLESLGTPAYLYRISKRRQNLETLKGYARIDRYGKGEFIVRVDRPSGPRYRRLVCSTEESKVHHSVVWLTNDDSKLARIILIDHWGREIEKINDELAKYINTIKILLEGL
ncbi:MAG TPA: hypothetical protein P5123_06580 [Spirochaetota bacterium]|nr:hypothetical protein [Spirochaetota bacterium]